MLLSGGGHQSKGGGRRGDLETQRAGQRRERAQGVEDRLGMEPRPCGQWEANGLYFAMGVLAYNLAQLLKRRVRPTC